MSTKLNREFGLQVRIRWLTRRDLSSVLEIERECFEHCLSYDDFVLCFLERHCIGLVAEADSEIVGYAVYEFLQTQFYLEKLAVRKDYRRLGVGSAMLRLLFDRISLDGRNQIAVEVRESNLAGQLFFRSHEFKAIVLRRNAHESGDDVYRMQYDCRPATLRGAEMASPERSPTIEEIHVTLQNEQTRLRWLEN